MQRRPKKPTDMERIFAYGRWVSMKEFKAKTRNQQWLRRFERTVVIDGDVSQEFLARMREAGVRVNVKQ